MLCATDDDTSMFWACIPSFDEEILHFSPSAQRSAGKRKNWQMYEVTERTPTTRNYVRYMSNLTSEQKYGARTGNCDPLAKKGDQNFFRTQSCTNERPWVSECVGCARHSIMLPAQRDAWFALLCMTTEWKRKEEHKLCGGNGKWSSAKCDNECMRT